ncbi:stress response translation initiation inhibitor YciH [Candidatus Woesearchaeota archaeon]|nr:stress response translation initiation inhibitor YciH [Candidatus Woesearchaeota archaeon]
MNDICPKCGLPKELCVCEDIAKESQKILVKKEKKKFGKVYTVVEGINAKEIDLKERLKKLKNRLSCGGTVKEGRIELQGDHTGSGNKSVKSILIESGFAPETIVIK